MWERNEIDSENNIQSTYRVPKAPEQMWMPRAVQRQQLRTGCNDLSAVSMYLLDEAAQAGNRASKARAAGSAETTAQNGMQSPLCSEQVPAPFAFGARVEPLFVGELQV